MSSIVMKSWGTAHGDRRYAGQYLQDFDFEAYDGRGEIVMTPDINRAMRFPSTADAWEFWRRQPQCKPLREDGKPNRPLTAHTWEFVDTEALEVAE